MLTDVNPDPKPRTGLRNYVLVSVAAFLLAFGYVGRVFWSRSHETRAIEERAADQKRAEDQRTFEDMGGNRFDILSFYVTAGTISRGDSAHLCYSVSNAKSVTLEPSASEGVWPSFERCVSVSPRKTTTYTLTATDEAGRTKSATVAVEVQ
jgi:hypothetical protein